MTIGFEDLKNNNCAGVDSEGLNTQVRRMVATFEKVRPQAQPMRREQNLTQSKVLDDLALEVI